MGTVIVEHVWRPRLVFDLLLNWLLNFEKHFLQPTSILLSNCAERITYINKDTIVATYPVSGGVQKCLRPLLKQINPR